MPTVLIVDDQPADRRILGEIARRIADDIRVEAFGSPGEALQWLWGNKPDLILADYRMPEMDGLAFLQACRRIPFCTGIPTLIITIVQDRDLRRQALAAGVTDFLTKPLDVQECQARCRNLLAFRQHQLALSGHAEQLAEAHKRTGRALQLLSQQNRLLLEAETESSLLQGACDLLVELGEYPLAWLGLCGSDEPQSIRPLALAKVREAPEGVEYTAATGTPVLSALNGGEPVALNDLDQAAEDPDWCAALKQWGFRSMALLPLRVEGAPSGVLGVASHEPDAFDSEEIGILDHTAGNLGYGLGHLRTRHIKNQVQQDAEYLFHYDPLTTLPNRTHFLDGIEEHLAGKDPDPLAILAIKLDRFKLINDTQGHKIGSQLLLQAVQRCQSVLGSGDQLARNYGDRFLLLLRQEGNGAQYPTVARYAKNVAEQLIEVLQPPFWERGTEHRLGASIGITLVRPGETEGEGILSRADSAMHQAQEIGGNNYAFYSPERTRQHAQRLSLENRLHRAVEQNEFVVFYQPVLRMDSGTLVGAEALLRWRQENGSLLRPHTFIDLAEESGLVVPLGSWVFRQACHEVRELAEAGLDLRISVNLSTHQLLHADLTRELRDAVEEVRAPPDQLELEITEGAMMQDPPKTERLLNELNGYGLNIALDDFGTGYSSLTRLKDLPISTLKIDQHFIRGLPDDLNSRAIVNSIVQMAGNLEMRAVAEGVETPRQKRGLLEMGCPIGQGYYLSPPQSREGLSQLARKRGPEPLPNH